MLHDDFRGKGRKGIRVRHIQNISSHFGMSVAGLFQSRRIAPCNDDAVAFGQQGLGQSLTDTGIAACN